MALGYDLALAVREALERIGTAHGADVDRQVCRPRAWLGGHADQLLNEAREDIKRFQRPPSLLHFFECSDDAVDELEEAAALIELFLLIAPPAPVVQKLKELADLPLKSAQELVKCIECAATVTRSDVRDDLDEFLGRAGAARRHRARGRHGSARHAALAHLENIDQRQTMLVRELSQALETATDAQAHAGQALRTYLMDEVIA